MNASYLVYYPASPGQLNPAAVSEEFAKLGRNDALWQAFMQVVQERLAHATVDAANGEPSAAGRLQELLGLQQQFSAIRHGEPRKPARA
jgi:hypothetical protein